MKFLLLFFSALFLFSCQPKNNTEVVAKVGEHELSKSLLIQSLPTGLKGQDSIQWCNQWIEQWVIEQLLLDNAKELDDPANLDILLKNYENQLRIQLLKEKVISEQFDPQTVKAKAQEADSLSALSAKDMAVEIKKMEIWQNYQKQLMENAIQTGQWKK